MYKRKAAINNNNNSNSKRGNDISCGSVRSAIGMGIGNGNGGIEYKNIEKLSKRKLSPLRRNIIIGNGNNLKKWDYFFIIYLLNKFDLIKLY